MEYVNIQGLTLSKMTLGTVQLGLNYGIANTNGKPSLEKAFEILHTAIAGGVNAFDTASGYGDSESVLGSYFSQTECGPKTPVIATKFMLDEQADISGSDIEKCIMGFAEQSLAKLKISKIPLYMLHRAHDMTRFGDAVLKALKRLKSEGLIEKAGVSVYKPEEAEEMLKNDLYEAIQIPMNAFDTRMSQGGVLKKLKDEGRIVFVRSVFLQGLFFLDPDNMPAHLSSSIPCIKEMRNIAEAEGLRIAELALCFIRDMEGVTSLVLGAETPEQVSENIRLMESPKLRAHVYDRLEALSRKAPIEAIMQEFLKK